VLQQAAIENGYSYDTGVLAVLAGSIVATLLAVNWVAG
jgi:hypothetical protein